MREIRYDRMAAVEYAREWAFGRNPAYYDFEEIGGDCTNFASQCIYAGARVMNYTPEVGWYYISANNRTASWTGVEYLHKFLTENRGVGPYGHDVDITEVMPGDVIQLKFKPGVFQHSPVVVRTGIVPNPYNTLIAAHSYDAYNRRLSTYDYIEMRCIRIDGVRIE